VRPGRGFRTDQQEEKRDRLPIERIEFDGRRGPARRHLQIGNRTRFPVRYRDAVANAGRQDRLALADCVENVRLVINAVVVRDDADEFPQKFVLREPLERDFDAIDRQQIAQQQRDTSVGRGGFRPFVDPVNLRIVRRVINLSLGLAAALTVSIASRLSAQRILDLPMRAGPGADALATGPLAVFWNPGSIGMPGGRGEALVLDVRGPASTGLDGVGLAGIVRLDPRTVVGFGFQHVGISDIEETTTSPLTSDGAVPLDISENAFHFAALRVLGSGIGVGASVQYTRAADIGGGNDVVGLGAGFRYALREGSGPTIAGGLRFEDSNTDWYAGIAMRRPIRTGDWAVGADWGVAGSGRYAGVSHRLAASAVWQDRMNVGAGLAGEPGEEGRTWNPALGVSLQLSRYRIGVLREQLANGIGAVHTFRLDLAF
jgi:hypothetical protein